MISNLYIAQVKRANKERLLSKCGIEVGESFNKPKCPVEKKKAIKEVLKHFGMI